MGLMKKLGVEVSEQDLEDRILEFDKDKDGTIDFNEVFKFEQHGHWDLLQFLILMKDVVTDVHDDTRLHEV